MTDPSDPSRHPADSPVEATPAIIDKWLSVCEPGLRRHVGDRAPSLMSAARADNLQKAAAQRRFAETVTDRWLGLIAR